MLQRSCRGIAGGRQPALLFVLTLVSIMRQTLDLAKSVDINLNIATRMITSTSLPVVFTNSGGRRWKREATVSSRRCYRTRIFTGPRYGLGQKVLAQRLERKGGRG